MRLNLPCGAVAGGCADCDAYVFLDNSETPFVSVNTIHSDGCPALTMKIENRLIDRNETFEGDQP